MTAHKPATPLPQEWSGSPCRLDPDNFWVDDETSERVSAATGKRSPYTARQRDLLRELGEDV